MFVHTSICNIIKSLEELPNPNGFHCPLDSESTFLGILCQSLHFGNTQNTLHSRFPLAVMFLPVVLKPEIARSIPDVLLPQI